MAAARFAGSVFAGRSCGKDTIKPSAMQIYLFLPGGAAVPPRIGEPVRVEKMFAGVNARGRPLRLHTVPCVVAGMPAVRQS